MKRSVIFFFSVIAFFAFLSISCNKEDEGYAYFESDPEYEELPIYSCKGLNLWGGITEYKGKTCYLKPAKGQSPVCETLLEDSLLHLYFYGVNNKDTLKFCFNFLLKDSIGSYKDLKFLQDSLFYFDTENCTFSKKNKSDSIYRAPSSTGYVKFNTSKILNIEGVTSGIILAGVFEISYFNGVDSINIKNGRFDFLVNDKNFMLQEENLKDTIAVDSLPDDSTTSDTLYYDDILPNDSLTKDTTSSSIVDNSEGDTSAYKRDLSNGID